MAPDADPDPGSENSRAQAIPTANGPIENPPGGSPASGAAPLDPQLDPQHRDAATATTATATAAAVTAAAAASPLATLRDVLDRLLVANVFLVIAGALWFVLAVLLNSRGLDAPLGLFQKLWQPLFTPAIGLLMAAALLSGALGWWQRRGPGGVRGTGS